MSIPVILAIDEGTTNAKVIVVNYQGDILAKSSLPLPLTHPCTGFSEQDPMIIWDTVCIAIRECLAKTKDVSVVGVTISNQRESILIWERTTGKPLTPLVIWQDRRSEEYCGTLKQKPIAQKIFTITGLAVDPLFPSTKIRYLLQQLPNGNERAQKGELCIGTVDSWLTWQLTKGKSFVTDYSNASRTQLFNIHSCRWDDEILDFFAIPKQCLAQVNPSSSVHGYVADYPELNIPQGTPIVALIGDSHAALYGQGVYQFGEVKATYGTGSSLMSLIPSVELKTNQLSTTIAWHNGQLHYALEGNINHTGSGFAWLGRMLDINDIAQLSAMAQSVTSNHGVYFVPALAGLGAPHWQPKAKGILTGLTDSTTPAIIARAGLESIAYQIADVFFAMQTSVSNVEFSKLYVDGGPTENNWLMQFQADLLQCSIIRNLNCEVSALGSAYLGGKTLNWWNDEQIVALPRNIEIIQPERSNMKVMMNNYQFWQDAVKQTCYQSQTQ